MARHEPSGQLYAGIDGGGYSFLSAQWGPLYLRFTPQNPVYVPTANGLRRVVRS